MKNENIQKYKAEPYSPTLLLADFPSLNLVLFSAEFTDPSKRRRIMARENRLEPERSDLHVVGDHGLRLLHRRRHLLRHAAGVESGDVATD